MTDNDIIKALECCKGEDIPCADCPYIDFGQCQTYVASDALRLINRLKTEIEKLEGKKENLESIQEISPEAKHFVDTKADKVISLLNEAIKSQKQIKAEAIKEFAENVKKNHLAIFNTIYSHTHFCEMIDNLVKEMTEDNDNG